MKKQIKIIAQNPDAPGTVTESPTVATTDIGSFPPKPFKLSRFQKAQLKFNSDRCLEDARIAPKADKLFRRMMPLSAEVIRLFSKEPNAATLLEIRDAINNEFDALLDTLKGMLSSD